MRDIKLRCNYGCYQRRLDRMKRLADGNAPYVTVYMEARLLAKSFHVPLRWRIHHWITLHLPQWFCRIIAYRSLRQAGAEFGRFEDE